MLRTKCISATYKMSSLPPPFLAQWADPPGVEDSRCLLCKINFHIINKFNENNFLFDEIWIMLS